MNLLFVETTQSLSQISNISVWLFTITRQDSAVIRSIDFINLKMTLLIAVVVNDKGIVKNKIIKTIQK